MGRVIDQAKMATNRKTALRRRHPLLEIGGGPWRVLDECPSQRWHNTYAAARGRDYMEGVQCICPHARQVLRDFRTRENAKKRARNAASPAIARDAKRQRKVSATPNTDGRQALYISDVAVPGMPDLGTVQLCLTPEGRAVVDRTLTTGNGGIVEMKKLCGRCPAKERCAKWVLEAERTPGGWGGVYGGMSPADRRLARKGEVLS